MRFSISGVIRGRPSVFPSATASATLHELVLQSSPGGEFGQSKREARRRISFNMCCGKLIFKIYI
jgi:hypothetical protein